MTVSKKRWITAARRTSTVLPPVSPSRLTLITLAARRNNRLLRTWTAGCRRCRPVTRPSKHRSVENQAKFTKYLFLVDIITSMVPAAATCRLIRTHLWERGRIYSRDGFMSTVGDLGSQHKTDICFLILSRRVDPCAWPLLDVFVYMDLYLASPTVESEWFWMSMLFVQSYTAASGHCSRDVVSRCADKR